jgi:iron complex outermembrane recepter protein
MKKLLVFVLIILVSIPSFSQKKSERIKRKYRKVERVDTRLPEVFLWGKVENQEKELLQGVTVVLIGSKRGVNTNTEGEYLLTGVAAGRQRIQASLAGYKTKYTDIVLQDGINELYFTLDKETVSIDPLVSTVQKREQQILDIPTSVHVFNRKFLDLFDATQSDQIARFTPGVDIRFPNSNNSVYTFRGITSENYSIGRSPKFATFYNEIPITQLSGSTPELFDMERVEILKGPQPATFGSEAEMGAIHYISKKPSEKASGYLSARYGNFGYKTIEGAMDIPIVENTLLARMAGFYNYHDGYVVNSFGGNLNGTNKMGGRFSLRFLPNIFTHFDLTVDYQKNHEPGKSFINPTYPNRYGETNVFGYRASLNAGDSLANNKEVFGSILNIRHYISEQTYISSITAYFINASYELKDEDGTAANALNFSNDFKTNLFSQEFRLNFTRNSQWNGFLGVNYRREKTKQSGIFSTNEQNLYNLFLDPANLVGSNGLPNIVPAFPIDTIGIISGTPLPAFHQESQNMNLLRQTYESFFETTINVTYRFRLFGGARMVYNNYKLSGVNLFTGGENSVLGQITGFTPNVIFKPSDTIEVKYQPLVFLFHGGIYYKFSPDVMVYANFSIGQSPKSREFQNDATFKTISGESISHFELGYKGILKSRLWFDAAAYYYNYSNFLTKIGTIDTAGIVTNTSEGYTGKATAYGVETNLKFVILKHLEFFGNYSWSKTLFDGTDKKGNPQLWAGNRFRMAPEHSFSVGINVSTPIGSGIEVFARPTYSYKTDFFFDEANSDNMKQPAYGVLNAQIGLTFKNPNITFLVFGTNILNEHYLDFAGTMNDSFKLPLFVPAPPRMFGTKLTWNYEIKKRPYYQRQKH